MGAIYKQSKMVTSNLYIVSGLKEGMGKMHKTPIFDHWSFFNYYLAAPQLTMDHH